MHLNLYSWVVDQKSKIDTASPLVVSLLATAKVVQTQPYSAEPLQAATRQSGNRWLNAWLSFTSLPLPLMFFADDDHTDHRRQQKKSGHLERQHVFGE